MARQRYARECGTRVDHRQRVLPAPTPRPLRCRSARLAFAIAHAYGFDIYLPAVCNVVLYCIVGGRTERSISAAAPEVLSSHGRDSAGRALALSRS